MSTATISKVETSASEEYSGFRNSVTQHLGEYLPTFGTEFTVLLSQILLYKFAAHYLGKSGFSEYAVVRRLVSLIAPIPLLGIGIGLPRYIGFSKGNGDGFAASRYYHAALTSVASAALFCALLMNIGRNYFAFIFFGSKSYSHFVFPLSAMIVGLCLHTIACGYFRGNMAMNRANLLQLINLAFLPPIVFAFTHKNLEHFLLLVGVFWIFTASVTLIATALPIRAGTISREAGTLLRYGVQRVPGDFTLMALFTLPVTVVAHLEGVQQAGYIAFAIAMLSMIGAVFQPIGLVLLPKATYMFAEGTHRELYLHVLQLLKISLLVCALLVFSIALFATPLIRLYLGPGYEPVASLVRIIVIGALPYSVYLVLRNVIDAFHKNGVTALILLLSLFVFGAGILTSHYIGYADQVVVPSFLFGILILAIAAGWECRRILL